MACCCCHAISTTSIPLYAVSIMDLLSRRMTRSTGPEGRSSIFQISLNDVEALDYKVMHIVDIGILVVLPVSAPCVGLAM